MDEKKQSYNIENIRSAKSVVIGDIMLDRYIFGSVARISPEAPVPVVKAVHETESLGGAANVAHNIAGLGASCTVVGVAGEDQYRNSMLSMLTDVGVTHRIFDAGLQTTTKIRVLGERQQIVRIDYEDHLPPNSQVFSKIRRCAEELLPESGSVILSDYGKGLMTHDLCQFIIKSANQRNIISIVDPKGADWSKYQNATLITPNVKELSEAANEPIENEDKQIEKIGAEIREKYGLTYLVITRSEKGISVITKDSALHFPTEAQEVFDVSGAGDTVVATLACVMGSGGDIMEAVIAANKAAGVVVSRIGTVPVLYEDLLRTYCIQDGSGAIHLNDLLHTLTRDKKQGKQIVFTNGCFDIIHRGHIQYLKDAKNLGDILVVGLNSDSSVKRLKGEGRPVNSVYDRAFHLSALESVDYVVIFDEDTPQEILEKIRPDTLVKGGDYSIEKVIGRQYAGKVVIIPFVDGYSTTSMIEKMKERN